MDEIKGGSLKNFVPSAVATFRVLSDFCAAKSMKKLSTYKFLAARQIHKFLPKMSGSKCFLLVAIVGIILEEYPPSWRF